jgi:hypothetical protein
LTGQRVLELAGDLHIHLEHPLLPLLLVLGLAGVAQRHAPALIGVHVEAVRHRLPGCHLVALAGELGAVELLPVVGVRGLQLFLVLDADGPVRVADAHGQRDVVRERHVRRIVDQVEAGEGAVLDGDLDYPERAAEDDDGEDNAGDDDGGCGYSKGDAAVLELAPQPFQAVAVATPAHFCFASCAVTCKSYSS